MLFSIICIQCIRNNDFKIEKSTSYPNQPNQPNEPNQPPKREPTPIPLPTVGLGKDQVNTIRKEFQYAFVIYLPSSFGTVVSRTV